MKYPNKKDTNSFLTMASIKDIVIIAFIIIVSWKLLNSNISINIKEFGFSDLTAFFLAFFSISLSVAFYFKANDTSNLFYDNVYKFTKDTSEILGRIEAGFGERLKHIDEGYTGLINKFDQIPMDIKEEEDKIKLEQKEIKKIEDSRNTTIDELIQKAQIKDKEKKELLKKIKMQDEEYSEARKELFTLKRNLDDIQLENDNLPLGLEHYVNTQIKIVFGHKSTESTVKRQFNKIIHGLHKNALRDMKYYDLINDNYELTPKGSIFINKIMKENR